MIKKKIIHMNIILSCPAGLCVPFVFTQLHETMQLLAGSSGGVMGDSYIQKPAKLKESLNQHQKL